MPNIVYLSGYARVGKGEVARYLVENRNYIKFSFADKVKEVAKSLSVRVSINGKEVDFPYWCGTEESKRFPCVEIGHKLRGILGEDIWVNALRNSGKFQEAVLTGADIVIDDVRYLNEFSLLSASEKHTPINVYIDRRGREPQGAEEESFAPIFEHITFDHIIHNDFHTVSDLHKYLDSII